MLCEAPFHPNLNYLSDNEHDQNHRKFWFLVFGVGLFTAKYARQFLALQLGPLIQPRQS